MIMSRFLRNRLVLNLNVVWFDLFP
jgi:hypothetical protein